LYRAVHGAAPELLVVFDDLDRRALSLVGAGTIDRDRDDTREGDGCNHDWNGIFIGAGMRARGELEDLSIYDVGDVLADGRRTPDGWSDASGAGWRALAAIGLDGADVATSSAIGAKRSRAHALMERGVGRLESDAPGPRPDHVLTGVDRDGGVLRRASHRLSGRVHRGHDPRTRRSRFADPWASRACIGFRRPTPSSSHGTFEG
jgi:hypothetical protein